MIGRRLTPDDLLAREELGEVALSPDGRLLAYVVKRPRLSAEFHKRDFLFGNDRADVWLVPASGGEPRQLTVGAEHGCGYWAPEWSPDGRRLAMLSTRDGNVGLWVYDFASRSLFAACECPLDLVSLRDRPARWVSSDRLLLATLPEGERPTLMTVEFGAAERAMREWPMAWSGAEATASVLESGSEAPFAERPQGKLIVVDLKSEKREPIMRGFFRELRLSPDKRHVAFARQVDVLRPKPDETLLLGYTERRTLGVITPAGEMVVESPQAIEQWSGTPLRWSPDSAELAVIGRPADRTDAGPRVLRCRLGDGVLAPATPPGLEPAAFVWAANDELVILAGPAPMASEPHETTSRSWWHIGSGDQPRELTDGRSAVPQTLIAEQGLRSFVGLACGSIFRLSLEDGEWTELTADFEGKVASIVWPEVGAEQAVGQLVLAVEGEGASEWLTLDLGSGELNPLETPAAGAAVAQFVPDHGTAVVRCSDRSGDRLWLSRPAFARNRPIAERNTWLAELEEGELRRISYTSLDGDQLKGWLMLPVGYDEATRYPLVAAVYPGAVYARDEPSALRFSINGHHCLNLQLLAGHGFAVLFPSMPLRPEGETADPYVELTKGVLPAIDKAIELGVADPVRLGVIGQSYGGYGVYGLITQTRRFRAAVALAGLADLISLYGQFDARLRYDDRAHEHIFQATLMEAGQLRMGSPPWKDATRYLRNSPLFHAERVETPILVIQGDMDYVALQQGEQFFAALYRQGRRARFVRYWGEGHVLQGPPNIRHMWEQIFAWFDEFLAPAAEGGPDAPPPP